MKLSISDEIITRTRNSIVENISFAVDNETFPREDELEFILPNFIGEVFLDLFFDVLEEVGELFHTPQLRQKLMDLVVKTFLEIVDEIAKGEALITPAVISNVESIVKKDAAIESVCQQLLLELESEYPFTISFPDEEELKKFFETFFSERKDKVIYLASLLKENPEDLDDFESVANLLYATIIPFLRNEEKFGPLDFIPFYNTFPGGEELREWVSY